MKAIFDDITNNRVIALIGNCKNSGKTTTLNYLLHNFKDAGVVTVGLDGEDVDLLYGTFKPKVRLHKGQYVCTLANEVKHNFEIIEKLDFKDLYIAKALSDSDLLTVNPGGKKEVVKVISKMLDRASVVFVDGAFDKISSLSIVESVILCVGSSDEKLKRLKMIYKLLNLPIINLNIKSNSFYDIKSRTFKKIDCDPMNEDCLQEILKQYDNDKLILLKGALTSQMAVKMNNVKILVKDPSRVLMPNDDLTHFLHRKNELFVTKRPKLLFVSINTFNEKNIDKDPKSFYKDVKGVVGDTMLLNLMNGGG